MEKIEKIIKELFPKKALDLDSFIHVIKTSQSKKFSIFFKLFQGVEKDKELPKFSLIFVKEININSTLIVDRQRGKNYTIILIKIQKKSQKNSKPYLE